MSALLDKMLVFKSLNCAFCELPFSPSAKDLRAPRKLRCGLTVCVECFSREKLSMITNVNPQRVISAPPRQNSSQSHPNGFPRPSRYSGFSSINQSEITYFDEDSPEMELFFPDMVERPTDWRPARKERRFDKTVSDPSSKRKTKTHPKHSCSIPGICFQKSDPVYFLNDILSNEALSLSPSKDGYILTKPFSTPECSLCHEELNLNERMPIALECNHMICDRCLIRIEEMSPRGRGRDGINDWVYGDSPRSRSPVCPYCNHRIDYNGMINQMKNNPLTRFIQELPAMRIQMEKSLEIAEQKKLPSRQCIECEKTDKIQDMFSCVDCQKTICGACTYRRHRDHNCKELIHDEIKRVTAETKETIENQMKTYKEMIPQINQDLLDKMGLFEQDLFTKIQDLEKLTKFEEVFDGQTQCMKLGEEFEKLSEEFIPHLRTFDKQLQSLVESMNGRTREISREGERQEMPPEVSMDYHDHQPCSSNQITQRQSPSFQQSYDSDDW